MQGGKVPNEKKKRYTSQKKKRGNAAGGGMLSKAVATRRRGEVEGNDLEKVGGARQKLTLLSKMVGAIIVDRNCRASTRQLGREDRSKKKLPSKRDWGLIKKYRSSKPR